MSRPVPLAIISFLLGVLAVVMFIAPRYYTIEDAIYSHPQYAEQIRFTATIEGAPAAGMAVAEGDSPSAAERLVIRLQNAGELTVWGKIECRVSGFSAPIIVPVPILPPNMEQPAVYSISLVGATLPEGEEQLQVRARWAKLYGM